MNAVATPALTSYQIDVTHSEASFQVRHLLSKVRGRFTDFAGTLAFDEANPEAASVVVEIKAASIETHQADRDAHLRSDDFFAADTYPLLTFRSKRVHAKSTTALDVTGDLTIRGVTREIVLPVAYLGQVTDPWGARKAHFEAETTINRKDFGLNWNTVLEAGGFLVGDEVRIEIAVEAAAK